MAFREGVTNKRLAGKLETHNVETVSELFALVDKCARDAKAHTRVECRGAPEETSARDGPRNPVSRRTSRRLPLSCPRRGAQGHSLGETLPAVRGGQLLPAKTEASGGSSIAPTGTTSPSAFS